MYDFDEMEPNQAKHLNEVARLWSRYGSAMRTWSTLDGGMTWKRVAGGEYLCRYRQDPETGKKIFNSLGRRSAETEKSYVDFLTQRDGARQTVISMRDEVATAGRVAKAYGVARLPANRADVLRRLWIGSMTQDLTVFGGTALFAYELESRLLAPAEVFNDDRLLLVGERSDEMIEAIAKTCEAAGDGACRVRKTRTGIHFETPGVFGLQLWDGESIVNAAESREEADVLTEAFALPRHAGVTVSRGAQPLEIVTLDPRAYAVAAHVLGREEPIWTERARFAAAVAERLELEFDPGWAEVFHDVVAGNSIDQPRI